MNTHFTKAKKARHCGGVYREGFDSFAWISLVIIIADSRNRIASGSFVKPFCHD